LEQGEWRAQARADGFAQKSGHWAAGERIRGIAAANTVVRGHVHVEIDGALKDREHCLQCVFVVALDVELIVQV
jgi:hypothetical protein